MAEVRFEKIQKGFRDTLVLRELNLTIGDREFFTFVGPSGCGKSTLLNLVAGLERPSSGTLYFDGRSVNDLPPAERDAAMVFQSYALYPHMTVYGNLAFPLRIRKQDPARIETEIRRVAAVLGLEELLHRRPRQLSGGQRQRVALGRAIIRRPRVFLMDEPLSNLDARLRIEMRAELKRIHREFPITTIYVTHDQEEAMVLSDRIAVLYQGALQQCGPPMEVYREPANLAVAEFIGSPPMNLIPGEAALDLGIPLPGARGREGEVIVGIRPSDLWAEGPEGGGEVEADVQGIESTGTDRWVDLRCGGAVLKAKAAPDAQLHPAAPCRLRIPRDRLHFFDRRSGRRLAAAF